MLIRGLFRANVTRDIPPVVYFHEQSPEKLLAEVSEYIITGGWPEGHPNRRRVPSGIHEQYVRLLRAIAAELERPGGPELPTSWISGFYGSGKSSFAKLLGMALDRKALPDGSSLAEAWLDRDTTVKAKDLRNAWKALLEKVEPLAVVFDIGGSARDGEHLHAAVVRKVQERLGYCSTEPLVADFELGLERDGHWERFEEVAREVLGRPWSEVKDQALAEEEFSLVLSVLFPERYTDPMSWFMSRGGTHARAESPEDAATAIRDMLRFRRPEATLFVVVDEVSQYVLTSKDRVDRLRAFATALGSTLRGKAWLLALGQQQLDQDADDSFLVWAKDRFPPKLRVHLAATNIRDVVHKRLLHKTPEAERRLRTLFAEHRHDLQLFAYGCGDESGVTAEEFVEVYPMLPGQIDLILLLTTELRSRSGRAQGDDQAIRGLLQLLGELFREVGLAEKPVGHLVTLDQIYEVQHTALDSDTQDSMAQVLSKCTAAEDELLLRAAKAVALLELIQDSTPTTSELVAKCLYDRIDRGNQTAEIKSALEELRRRNLLGYSERSGYKIQSSAAAEWERERRDLLQVPREHKSQMAQEALKTLLGGVDRLRFKGREFRWAAVFSDGRRAEDAVLADPREAGCVRADFRFLPYEDRTEGTWIRRSGEAALRDRLIWVVGDTHRLDELAKEVNASRAMVRRYRPVRESLPVKRKNLLNQEESRARDLEAELKEAVAAAWMAGSFYFRGQPMAPSTLGGSFAVALHGAGTRILPDLFPHFIDTQIAPAELMQLLAAELSGPSPKFLGGDLGLLELDSGRYVPSVGGVVPKRVLSALEKENGFTGTALLSTFGGPPYGYAAGVIKACIAGLLRASRVRVQPEGGAQITSRRDPGVRDLFEKDREFRRALILPAGEDDIGHRARARICRFFEDRLGHSMDREDHRIADAVMLKFPLLAAERRDLQAKLNRLPTGQAEPQELERLGEALEQCLSRARETQPTVQAVKRQLHALQDGVDLLRRYQSELSEEVITRLRDAHGVLTYQAAQLGAAGALDGELGEAAESLREQFSSRHPWRDLAAVHGAVDALRAAYVRQRERELARQETQVEEARHRLRGRDGFAMLTADDAHAVLRPLAEASGQTTAEAVAPPLEELQDRFVLALQRAEDEANETLDRLLSRGNQPLIQPLDLGLRHRQVTTEADVEALVEEIRERLLEVVRSGTWVRLV